MELDIQSQSEFIPLGIPHCRMDKRPGSVEIVSSPLVKFRESVDTCCLTLRRQLYINDLKLNLVDVSEFIGLILDKSLS